MLELIMARMPCFCQVIRNSCLRRCSIALSLFRAPLLKKAKLFASGFALFASLKAISVRQVITHHDLCMIFPLFEINLISYHSYVLIQGLIL